jgi:hypothetical protein
VDLCSVAAEDLPAAARVVHAPSPAVHYSEDSSFFGCFFLFLSADCI